MPEEVRKSLHFRRYTFVHSAIVFQNLLMLRKLFLYVFIASLMTTACSDIDNNQDWNLTRDTLRYASLLDISRADSFVLVTVKDPWTQEQDLHRYILVPDTAPMPNQYPEGTLLRTPLRRVIMHNAVHAALVTELGCEGAIKGLCDVEYVRTPQLRTLLEKGAIANAGSSVQSDVERYIAMKTDAVFTSPLEHASYGILEKVNIPLIECADYMENSALGRAEWMLFFGLLFDCETRAKQLFNTIATNYISIRESVKHASKRPQLIVDTQNGDAWNMPGGNSYLGKLYADAGTDYILKDDTHRGSVPLSFETVFSKGAHADFWLIKNARTTDLTYNMLKREHAAHATFTPWKKHTIYVCNTRTNDYYEHIPFHPDVLLQELAALFHPECIKKPITHRYYQPLKQQ